MKYCSTSDKALRYSLKEAVIKGLAPNMGLFMPERIPVLSKYFFSNMHERSFQEIAAQVIAPYLEEAIGLQAIEDLIAHTLCFEVPLVPIRENVYALELFHGPTLAFKDIGARFSAGLMSTLKHTGGQKIKVLVATSGDTGSAVANGFYEAEGVEVIILYPSGKVSSLQEKQFTSLGKNITALEVDGSFDDCQQLVKMAFSDEELNEALVLTSANSINIARWLPQCLYYFYAYAQMARPDREVSFAVPSGNFGNLAAGVLAWRMGLPVKHFIAATNKNDVVPAYLNGSEFIARPSLQTISNAMDVGNPSNFLRLLALFDDDEKALRSKLIGFSFDDEATKNAMRDVYRQYNYVLDPHGAVGYLGLQAYQEKYKTPGILLETAHPGKFRETVEDTLSISLKLPDRLEKFISMEKKSVPMKNNYKYFKSLLLSL